MQITEVIKRATASFDEYSKGLYMVAAIEQQINQQEARFDEVKAQVEAKRTELADLEKQISEAKATLDQLRTERATLEDEIKRLTADRGAIARDIERAKERLVA